MEEAIGSQLLAAGARFAYEQFTIPYEQPVKVRRYTPDYVLSNGIIIESKGRFITADRQKHLLIKQQYPDLDIRFVFSNARSRIGKKSKTTYGDWCESKGFLYASKLVPEAWLRESPNAASIQALKELQR